MNINSHINFDIQPLITFDSVKKAKSIAESHAFSHLPVVEQKMLLGCVSQEDIQGFDDDKKLEDYLYALDAFFVRKQTNWVEVLEAFAQHESNIMPVLNEKSEYIGYYELLDIIGLFNQTPFLNEPGGILLIEKGLKDYSFSEISQIVESNNGKLLGAFISEMNENQVQITLKVGNAPLNSIIQSFRRFNYNIVIDKEDDSYLKDLKDKSDYLQRYLNI